jgi:hypothetical protein
MRTLCNDTCKARTLHLVVEVLQAGRGPAAAARAPAHTHTANGQQHTYIIIVINKVLITCHHVLYRCWYSKYDNKWQV